VNGKGRKRLVPNATSKQIDTKLLAVLLASAGSMVLHHHVQSSVLEKAHPLKLCMIQGCTACRPRRLRRTGKRKFST
jgi:hypothetical protein